MPRRVPGSYPQTVAKAFRRRAWIPIVRDMWMLIALAITLLFAASPSHAVSVIGDDDRDRYVGSGGLILPGAFSRDTRESVARCVDCRWRLRDPCADHDETCRFTPLPCPDDHRVLETLWSRDAGATWQSLGLWCVGPQGPRTVGSVGSRVVEELAEELPPGRPSVQPPRGIVAQLPTIWHAQQPPLDAPMVMNLVGHRVEITATPRWSWDFGDGGRLETSQEGSRYPDFTVSHTYRKAGRYTVTCTTTWEATFTVDGLGPFPVAEPITQEARRAIRVAEARARLVREHPR